jgi:hypothetical protein
MNKKVHEAMALMTKLLNGLILSGWISIYFGSEALNALKLRRSINGLRKE